MTQFLESSKDETNKQQQKVRRSWGSEIVGCSPKFLKALDVARRVAGSSASILLTGESGSGKEVFAKFIHNESKHRSGRFVAINCSAIPENLLESELFGHAKGAFTGAHQMKEGLFEEAQGGTLFLDEIGDLGLNLQAKLLRVLQEKNIKRLGENHTRLIDCRIISATHRDLSIEVAAGRFREDLFFRLNVIPISIPSLRERPEDLILLAESFLKKFAVENASLARSFSDEAMCFLIANPWRGNVRELENTIERAAVLSTSSEISLEDLMPLGASLSACETVHSTNGHDGNFSVHVGEHLPSLDDIIRQYVEFAVDYRGGVRDKTAKEIGIDRKTLYKRLGADSSLNH